MQVNQFLKYLGCNVSTLLECNMFSNWNYEKTIEKDTEEPIIHYTFANNGLELRCNAEHKIKVIFLHSKEYMGYDDSQFDVPFSMCRDEVLACLDKPFQSGDKTCHPVLGEFGAWDKFKSQDSIIHVEYNVNSDSIKMITLIK